MRRVLVASAGVVLLAAGSPLKAYQAPPAAPTEAPCTVVDAAAGGQGQAAHLHVICGPTALRLGYATRYASSFDAVSGGIVVVREIDLRTLVQLVALDAGGMPVIEDLSRDIAKAAGYNPDGGLDEGVVDANDYAARGVLRVRREGPPGAQAGTIDYDLRPAVERMRAQGSASQPEVQQ